MSAVLVIFLFGNLNFPAPGYNSGPFHPTNFSALLALGQMGTYLFSAVYRAPSVLLPFLTKQETTATTSLPISQSKILTSLESLFTPHSFANYFAVLAYLNTLYQLRHNLTTDLITPPIVHGRGPLFYNPAQYCRSRYSPIEGHCRLPDSTAHAIGWLDELFAAHVSSDEKLPRSKLKRNLPCHAAMVARRTGRMLMF